VQATDPTSLQVLNLYLLKFHKNCALDQEPLSMRASHILIFSTAKAITCPVVYSHLNP